MTHKDLVKRASDWLRRNGYAIVITELRTIASETPDAYGHKYGVSTIIECKASRADFLADKKKRFRICPDYGMGDRRYFMAPKGILTPEDLPEGWGLLEASEHRVKVLVEAPRVCGNTRAENIMLISVIRRLELSTAVFVVAEPHSESEVEG